jgi:tetratricopeptide (TPR) repeat protein
MDSSDFSVLVGRLERQADEHPGIYGLQVGIVAALGYAPVLLAGAAIVAAGCFCIASVLEGSISAVATVALVLAAIALTTIVRALSVRVESPAGREVTREEAPDLFAPIDDVLRRTQGPKRSSALSLERVTLDAEFDVGIRQLPRWGVFGKYTNHLHVSIPLLAALSIAEFKTLIAHEIGHLGINHSKFAAWIYRQRGVWLALQRKLANPRGVLERVLGAFYGWYVPYFSAYTFVLARNHEYQADQVAAWATDARVFARALLKRDLAARFVGEIFLARFYAQVERTPEPPYLPFSMMPRALSVAQKEWLRMDWLEFALRRLPADGDTHPSLGERLMALDVQTELPTHTPDKTALSLLGRQAATMLKWCDGEWQASNAEAWRKRHEEIKEARWKIAQYESTPASELKSEDLWEKSLLLLDLGQEPAAVEELRALILLEPQLAKAQFLLGRLLLESGDESGLQNLAIAAQQSEEFLEPAGHLGYGYLMDRGRKGEAVRFWEKCRAA